MSDDVNDRGLSRKHLVESLHQSLMRLRMDYLDLYQCHRPDPETPVEETAMDLVVEDGSRVQCVYFLMSEENVAKKIRLPWVSLCSDSGEPAPVGDFLKSNPHPRAYGSFARLLRKYVREAGLTLLQEAVHRLTQLPAENMRLKDRGLLAEGRYADIAVFDPQRVRDNATYEDPHQLASGVLHVFVNGVQVLRDGEHTGATPGKFVRGPGWY